MTRFAQTQSDIWREVAQRLPDNGRALIVTHGQFVELGAIASLPNGDYEAWGGAIGYCEGVRLTISGAFDKCEVLRVPVEHQLIEN